jgi:preprotein translocase subunit YajC
VEVVMVETLQDYWPIILIAIVLLAIAAFLILRPRQRVQLTQSAPVRPHMAQRDRTSRSEG